MAKSSIMPSFALVDVPCERLRGDDATRQSLRTGWPSASVMTGPQPSHMASWSPKSTTKPEIASCPPSNAVLWPFKHRIAAIIANNFGEPHRVVEKLKRSLLVFQEFAQVIWTLLRDFYMLPAEPDSAGDGAPQRNPRIVRTISNELLNDKGG